MDLVRVALPKIIKRHGFEYGRGIIHTLDVLLDSNLIEPIEDELIQYQKRFDGLPADKCGDPLDLFNSSVEDLARTLSDMMHNPNLPVKIHNCLADELSENHDNTPESIAANLKTLLTQESKESAKWTMS